jgi:hypothetical protein
MNDGQVWDVDPQADPDGNVAEVLLYVRLQNGGRTGLTVAGSLTLTKDEAHRLADKLHLMASLEQIPA